MKYAIAIVLVCTNFAVGSAAFACHHDIMCPAKWVWSDAEGSCVEAPGGTS